MVFCHGACALAAIWRLVLHVNKDDGTWNAATVLLLLRMSSSMSDSFLSPVRETAKWIT